MLPAEKVGKSFNLTQKGKRKTVILNRRILVRPVEIVENFAQGIFPHYCSFSSKSLGLIKMERM